jgi:regulator of nonsense transcripts 1
MIQFSKPRRTLVKSMDQFRRHETNARDFLGGSATGSMDRTFPFTSSLSKQSVDLFHFTALSRRSGTPSRFDASFYRTHDALGYIPSDVQSLRSQATYASGLPMFGAPGPFGPGGIPRGANGAKRSNYSYASSIVSQDAGIAGTDTGSVVGGSAASIAYSQSDRLRRRSSFGSASVAGTSELGSLSQYDYKSQDEAADLDDMKSQYAGTQSGVTMF